MESDTQSVKARTCDVKITEHVDFNGLLLSDAVLTGLKNAGFVRPSPIQLKAIPLGRCGLDLVVQAKSGTGKTCVFSVVALEGVTLDTANTQVLVLAPTREIAVQIWEVINSLGSALPGLRCYTFIGGMPLADDKVKLKKCHIAVGTPGRVKQLIELQVLNTESIRLFVLDEADKLMEAGFQESINWIYSSLPENKQMLALSATFPEVLAQHLTAYMRNPTFVRLNITDPALLGIRQYYKQVPFHPLPQKAFEAKCQALMCLLSEVVFQQCLVFSNYQLRAQSLSDILNAKGWPATYISGSQDQEDRLTAMAKLKKFKCRILISTDLTSRGIDAENVNLIINLDIPYDHETYLHRIGRAGRFGTYGAAVSFVSLGKETANLKKIEKDANTKIKVLPEPVPSDLTRSSGFMELDDLVTTEPLAQLKSDSSVTENGSQKDLQPTARSPSSTDNSDVQLGRGECNDPEPINSQIDNGSQNTIPDLIDSITQDVQIGYQEAENVLDGELEKEFVDQPSTKQENGHHVPHDEDGSYDVPTSMVIPRLFKLHHQVNSASDVCIKNVGEKSDVNEMDTCQSRIDLIPEVEDNVTKKANKLQRLDHILKTCVEPGDVDMSMPIITLPSRGCSAQNQSKALGYKDITADLKHFRDTGKLLHDTSSLEPNPAEKTNPVIGSFDEAVKDVSNFLHQLCIDPVANLPVKNTASSFETKSMESVDIHEGHIKDIYKDTMESTRDSLSLKQIFVNSKEDKHNPDTSLPAHKPIIQDSTMKTGVGARPKGPKKSYHTRSKLHKAGHKLGDGLNSPVSSSTVTDDDRVLGLDYMKKLTACLDPHSADESDNFNETDTTETESSYSTGSSKDSSVHNDDDYDGEDEDYYCEEETVDAADQGKTYRDIKWTSAEANSETDQFGVFDDPEGYYNYSTIQENIPGHSHIDDDGRWNDDQGVYYGTTPQEQAWYDECHPNVHYSSYDAQYPHMASVNNGWFPHQLWYQCHSLLGSINAMQASQYAWFCHQQYLYHTQNAKHFHSMYTQQHLELFRELRKQQEHIRNMTKMYAKTQNDL